MRTPILLAALVAISASAQAQVSLSKILFNPPGSDDTQEGVELLGAPNGSLNGYWFVTIDGDGAASGVVDQAISLDGLTLGSNGKLLLRDAANTVLPAPDAATNVFVQDFVPDIENGSNTYILGVGTAPAVGTDLDVDNDGILDLPLGTFLVLDAVSILETGTGAENAYADDFGFPVVPQFNGPLPAAHTPGVLYRLVDPEGVPLAWAGGFVVGTVPNGPYSVDLATDRHFNASELGFTDFPIHLGGPNLSASLVTSPGQRSIATLSGGSQQLTLGAGAVNAGRFYIVVGSLSGTAPGFPVDGLVLPLNLDFYTNLLLNSPNTLITAQVGFLDSLGRANPTFAIAPVSVPTPLTLHHAALVFDVASLAFVFVTNPVELVLE